MLQNLSNRKGFLFDLDGVLIDSEKQYTRIWREIESRFPTGVENFAQVIKGTTLKDIISNYFSKDAEAVKQLLYENETSMVYHFTPGAEALLKRLKENGHPIALVTSSDKAKMAKLEAQIPGFSSIFDVIIDGDMVSRSKPHPEGYLKAAELTGCSPEECVVIEDSVQGLKAGKAAGALTVGVVGTWPEDVIKKESDLIIDSLEEIII